MSAVFVPQNVRGNKGQVSQETIQKLLDENSHLIQCIVDNQSKGKIRECAQYQQVLHRNLVWLATVADSNQGNAQSLMSQTSPKQGTFERNEKLIITCTIPDYESMNVNIRHIF